MPSRREHPRTMDQLGGYRIVRKLGEGPRAEILLARSDGESESDASVVLKHYREGVDDASIAPEIEALARASGDHAVELLDVATAPSGSLALVLDRLPGGSLGRLLALRPTLELGELPTIVAPLGALLDRLHAAGVVHRGIRLESVLFDRAGAPMLSCFGRAELIDPALPPAALESIAGVHADQRALASLVAAVLDRADRPARGARPQRLARRDRRRVPRRLGRRARGAGDGTRAGRARGLHAAARADRGADPEPDPARRATAATPARSGAAQGRASALRGAVCRAVPQRKSRGIKAADGARRRAVAPRHPAECRGASPRTAGGGVVARPRRSCRVRSARVRRRSQRWMPLGRPIG